ncbi:MAG TPA: uracil phosphoribosyltransferase [Candidatus Faecicola pullistercoris]|nr:uracil phosphoribosyltransferase [Candidatus Faecicola pullistercoris]
MKNVTVFNHPLIAHKITHLCDVSTGTKEFREIVSELAMLMGYEAFRDLPTTQVEIQAPLSKFMSPVVNENITIVPILRAGLGMVEGLVALFPKARIGHIGLYRDEETLEPHEYYCKLPKEAPDGQVIVVDPALATGGSAAAAIDFIKQRGCKNIKLLSLIAAPEGIRRVTQAHPDVKIFVAHYADAPLNEKGYIVTAFGDAGDRIFGTK